MKYALRACFSPFFVTPNRSIHDVIVYEASVNHLLRRLLLLCSQEFKENIYKTQLKDMEDFHKRYTRICREQHTYPLDAVLNHIRRYLDGGLSGEESLNDGEEMVKLDLSGYNLSFFFALYPAVLAERLEKAADLLSIGRHISHSTNENKLIQK